MIAPDLATGIDRLRDMVESAKVVLPFTGAGISTECGIPDFRSPGGIWTKMRADPIRRLPGQPGDARRSPGGGALPWRISSAAPSPAAGTGRSPACIAPARCPALITQNIDNLHQASGIAAEHVVELHGNTTYATCLDCAKRYELAWVRQRFDASSGHSPDCPGCGGFIKTATVSFGQAMPEAAMRRAQSFDGIVRPVSRHRLVAGGVASRGLSVGCQTQRRAARHHQPRRDRVRRDGRSRRA